MSPQDTPDELEAPESYLKHDADGVTRIYEAGNSRAWIASDHTVVVEP